MDEVARKGSWLGGGSVAALSAALAAALLEKLTVTPSVAAILRAIRRACLGLVERDAACFSGVIQASRVGNHRTVTQRLKAATEIPCQVFEYARTVQAACRKAQRSVQPAFHSDLRCALALALAAETSARTLIETNLAWLGDPAYTRQVRRRLAVARRPR